MTTTTTTKPGWQTSEFWLKWAALALSFGYISGLIPTSGPIAMVAGVAGAELGSLGYTVMRTRLKLANGAAVPIAISSAPSSPAAPAAQPGRVRLPAMIAMAGLALAVVPVGCAWWSRGAAVSDVVDCVEGDAGQIVKELGPFASSLLVLLTGGGNQLDTAGLGSAAVNITEGVGGCVLADAAQRALAAAAGSGSGAPQSSPLVVDGTAVRTFLRGRFPGKSYKLTSGVFTP